MTLAAATRYANRIRCAVDIVGPSNFGNVSGEYCRIQTDLRRVEYGDERDLKIRAFLEGIAHLLIAPKINKPLLVIQGKNDPIVPISESSKWSLLRQKSGVQVWYLMAKDEGHGFSEKIQCRFSILRYRLFIKNTSLKLRLILGRQRWCQDNNSSLFQFVYYP